MVRSPLKEGFTIVYYMQLSQYSSLIRQYGCYLHSKILLLYLLAVKGSSQYFSFSIVCVSVGYKFPSLHEIL